MEHYTGDSTKALALQAYQPINTVQLNGDFNLHAYQYEAMEWLSNREEEEKDKEMVGSILCLKMGLGKTLITLYKIASDLIIDNTKKALIICSKTIIGEWINDLNKFFGQYTQLKVLIWHPDFRAPGFTSAISYRKYLDSMSEKDLENYHIIITTYEVCQKSNRQTNAEDRITIKGTSGLHEGHIVGYVHPHKGQIRKNVCGAGLLHNFEWDLIASDESQIFCNVKTKTFLSVCSLIGKKKLFDWNSWKKWRF